MVKRFREASPRERKQTFGEGYQDRIEISCRASGFWRWEGD